MLVYTLIETHVHMLKNRRRKNEIQDVNDCVWALSDKNEPYANEYIVNLFHVEILYNVTI